MNTKIGQPSFKKNGDVEKLIYLELRGSSYGISDLKWRKMITFLKGPCWEGQLGPPWKIITFLKAPCSSRNVFGWNVFRWASVLMENAKWICRNTEVLLQKFLNSVVQPIWFSSRWVFMVYQGSRLAIHGSRLVFHGSRSRLIICIICIIRIIRVLKCNYHIL